jgi:NADPH:quinone reductase-like Zn-dependent oxidoreductase
MTEPLLALRSIHKAYGRGRSRSEALTGVSLQVDAGESVAIVGRSGSGRTPSTRSATRNDSTRRRPTMTANDSTTTGVTMEAVLRNEYGPTTVLHVARIPRPMPADHEVLLRVHAAGLDRGTWHMMTGRPYLLRLVTGLRAPRNPVLGLDVAGTIVAVGAGVTRFAVGDEVFGFGAGSLAEYAVAHEDKLALKPAGLSFEMASVVPVSAATALQALHLGGIKAGQKVLITGASGGVGTYAVQLAKAFGGNVTGVCSTAKLDLVRSLGVDRVIDYSREDFADGTDHYDLILDIGGRPSLSRLRRALTRTGTAVLIGGEGGEQLTGGMGRQLRALVLSLVVRQRLTMFIAKQRAGDLEEMLPLIQTGTVTPTVDRTYPLGQAPEAMRHLEAGEARGKVAITV